MMLRRFIGIILLVCFIGLSQAQSPEPFMGTNLAGIADWSTEWAFVDAFKQARPWISQRQGANWGEGGELDLSPEGWIRSLQDGQYAETLMLTDEGENSYPLGDYVLLYEGEGDLSFWSMEGQEVLSQEQGRIVLRRSSQKPVFLRISATNPDNFIRNIRFIMPEFEATYAEQVFHPQFLATLEPFDVIRFMDWMDTNARGNQGEWLDRPQVSDATYMLRGVPVEVMLDLANRLGAYAWFTLPHAASDEYVREFATLVRDNLNSDLRAYVEYSNENWNGIFESHFYVKEQGIALNLASGDEFLAGMRFHSQRSVEIFKIWETVFGDTRRFERVMGAWAWNTWVNEQLLTWQDAAQFTDAIAIAPYFSCNDLGSPENAPTTRTLTVEALLDTQVESIAGCTAEAIRENKTLTERFGVDLIAYEGGQHLAGYSGTENDETVTNLFIAANRHPRMYDLYQAYFEVWYGNGGGLFMVFSSVSRPSQWGSWGFMETQTALDAPKYRAIVDTIQGR